MALIACHLPTGLYLDVPDPKHKGVEIRAGELAFGLNEVDDGVWKAWLAVHGAGPLMEQVHEVPSTVDAPAKPAKDAIPPAPGSAAARAAAKAANKGKS